MQGSKIEFTHLGLFEGIGGFSLAARWMGWHTKAWCEWNEFGQKVLRHHFPEAIGHGDITKTDFTPYANTIDILTGGDPCQPHSLAGKRKGKEDERYLWPEYKRCIKEVRPRWVVNENVPGSISNGVLDEKISDLEAVGYTWWPPFVIPASSVGANHARERVWLVAYTNLQGLPLRFQPGFPKTTGAYEPCPWGEYSRIHTADSRLQFLTKATILRGYDGVPNRVDRIKVLGNAIVPQVAYQIFKAIEQYELQTTHP